MSKENPKARLRLSRKAIATISAVVAVLVIAAAVGIGLGWMQSQSNRSSGNRATVTGFPATPIPKPINDAQNLAAQGNYSDAQKTLASAIGNANSSSDKYNLYLEQGTLYENQHDYADALTAYQNAAAAQNNPVAYEAIARIAQDQGNKQLEKDSLTKAIALLPNSNTVSNVSKQQLQDMLNSLGQ